MPHRHSPPWQLTTHAFLLFFLVSNFWNDLIIFDLALTSTCMIHHCNICESIEHMGKEGGCIWNLSGPSLNLRFLFSLSQDFHLHHLQGRLSIFFPPLHSRFLFSFSQDFHLHLLQGFLPPLHSHHHLLLNNRREGLLQEEFSAWRLSLKLKYFKSQKSRSVSLYFSKLSPPQPSNCNRPICLVRTCMVRTCMVRTGTPITLCWTENNTKWKTHQADVLAQMGVI